MKLWKVLKKLLHAEIRKEFNMLKKNLKKSPLLKTVIKVTLIMQKAQIQKKKMKRLYQLKLQNQNLLLEKGGALKLIVDVPVVKEGHINLIRLKLLSPKIANPENFHQMNLRSRKRNQILILKGKEGKRKRAR